MTYPHVDKRISNNELHKQGYLMEANRRFFHPLGLELRSLDPYDEESHLEVVDLRDIEGGPVFGFKLTTAPETINEYRDNIEREMKLRRFAREAKLQRGDVVEPIPPAPSEWSTEACIQKGEERRIDEYTEMLEQDVEPTPREDIAARYIDFGRRHLMDLARARPLRRVPGGGVAYSATESTDDGDWLEVRHDGPV